MKNQALFSSKDKSKKLKCPLQQFLSGALRVTAPWPQQLFKRPIKIFDFVCKRMGDRPLVHF